MKKIKSSQPKIFFAVLLIVAISSPYAWSQSALLEIRQEGAHQIVLKMSGPAKYKVFQLHSPERLFVYLEWSQIKAKQMELKCAGNYIRYAKIHPFKGDWGTIRVEIGIAEGLKYRGWAINDEIHLWVGKPSKSPPPLPISRKTAPRPPRTTKTVTTRPPVRMPTKITGHTTIISTKYVARPGNAPRASKLLNIMVTAGKGITQVVIHTNGPMRAFDDFLLVAPNRLVIDAFNAKADYVKPRIRVVSTTIEAIRWGLQQDRTRIVMELVSKSGPAPYYRIRKMRSGIRIFIYSTKTIDHAPASDFKTYTVSAGENLREIAKKKYGDSRAWRRIVSFNRDKFADPENILKSNGLLYTQAGTVLKLPIR